MNYWIIAFALDMIACIASYFYLSNGWAVAFGLEIIFIGLASAANFVFFLHTLTAIIRQHGVCTAADKWGPLSFIKYTHEATRQHLPILEFYLEAINLEVDNEESRDNLGMFAAHFNTFRIVQEEHIKHESSIIYKAFRDFFPRRTQKCEEDHQDDERTLAEYCDMVNELLDVMVDMDERKSLLSHLQSELPIFFTRYRRHMAGEEFDLLPIGEKFFPISLAIELIRDVWRGTTFEKWEVIIPFVVTYLPRHWQRTRYLKILTWCIPERAQQVGRILYRRVDAVMWERLRLDCPEIVPRDLPGWQRFP
jgi:hypothetical protein